MRRTKEIIDANLASLKEKNRLRKLVPIQPDCGLTDLTHNDYLSLRRDPIFQERVRQALGDLPVGSGASRLLGGEHPIFGRLEKKFAEFKDAESALLFPSGYAANEAVASVLAQGNCAYFSDELNHASIIDGIRLSRIEKDARHIYPHADLDTLAKLLRESDAETKVIFSESLFSMDGDRPDLKGLAILAKEFDAVLVLDEAHAIGCFGANGAGMISQLGLNHNQIISINTCGKALGVQGAVVCGPNWFRDWLINSGRSFIFTTAPSPWLAAALEVSLDYVKGLYATQRDSRKCRLLSLRITKNGF